MKQRFKPDFLKLDELLLRKLGHFYSFTWMVGGFTVCALLSLISYWASSPYSVKHERFYYLAIVVAALIAINLLSQVRRGLNSSLTIGASSLINGFILYLGLVGTLLSTERGVKIQIVVILILLVIINIIISATIKGRINDAGMP